MPVTYALESGVLHLIASGEYEPRDIPAAFLAGLADENCPSPVGLLFDVRQSDELAARSMKQIQSVAEFLAPHAERIGRRCAVVVSTDAQYGLSRMGSVFTEGVGVEAEVFRTAESAREWLQAGRSKRGDGTSGTRVVG